MKTKVLITGCEGNLGWLLYKKLKKYFNVIPTKKSNINSFVNCKNFKILDITNREDVKLVINESNPNIIINCAAITNVDYCEENHNLAYNVNVIGLANLLKAADKNVKIIQFSTDYVFSGKEGNYKETDPTYPISYYGKTKLESENFLRGSLNEYVIIRASVMYGNTISLDKNFFGWVFNSLKERKTINVVTDQISNPSYIPQLCDLVFKLILLNRTGIFHFGSEDSMTRFDFANAIADIFDLDKRFINPVDTKSIALKARRPVDSSLNTGKISDELNFNILRTKDLLELLYLEIN